jgi:hypothetical protein
MYPSSTSLISASSSSDKLGKSVRTPFRGSSVGNMVIKEISDCRPLTLGYAGVGFKASKYAMPPKTNKLTVYLIKPEYTTPEEILVTTGHSAAISQVGTFYFDESGVGKPSWITDFYGSTLGEDIKLLSASARGVLLVSIVHNARLMHR